MSLHQSIELTRAPLGRHVRIHSLRGLPETCTRLRELGFCENAVIRCIIRGQGNLICEICNARIGLNYQLAASIFVSHL